MTINSTILQELYLKKFDRDKQISTAITILLMLLFYLLLNMTQVPTQRRVKGDSDARDILIDKYSAQSQVKKIAPEPAVSTEPTPIHSRVAASVPTATPRTPDVKKMIAEMSAFLDDPVSQPLQDLTKRQEPKSSNSRLQIDQNDMSSLFVSMTTDNADMGASSFLKHAPALNHQRPELATLDSRPNVFPGKAGDTAIPDLDASLIEGKANPAASTVTQVNLMQLPDDLQTKMPVIFVKISQWMKENPVPLPNAFKKFMGYKPNHLTSRVDFQIGERFFEIYLVCVESTYEIKICLIEGDRTTLLIDEGFKHESHFLRTGKVFRTSKTGEILSFGTKQEEASKKDTREFYQIFLSWWRTTGMDKL